jgi:hypothetical protein
MTTSGVNVALDRAEEEVNAPAALPLSLANSPQRTMTASDRHALTYGIDSEHGRSQVDLHRRRIARHRSTTS